MYDVPAAVPPNDAPNVSVLVLHAGGTVVVGGDDDEVLGDDVVVVVDWLW